MNGKRGIWSCVALCAALLSACGANGVPRFDPANVRTVTGVVISVDPFTRLERNTRNGVAAELDTGEPKHTVAMLGPSIYLDKHGMLLQRGDEITVTGSNALGDDERSMFVVTELRKDDLRLELRDDNGRPAWSNVKLDR